VFYDKKFSYGHKGTKTRRKRYKNLALCLGAFVASNFWLRFVCECASEVIVHKGQNDKPNFRANRQNKIPLSGYAEKGDYDFNNATPLLAGEWVLVMGYDGNGHSMQSGQ
jgi:hypothetical protein